MATYTIYGETADGDPYAAHWTYSTARTMYPGTGLNGGTAATYAAVGQELNAGTYYIYQATIGFDTSSVVGTVTSATLDLYFHLDQSATDFTLEARAHNWGSTTTDLDYIVGPDITSFTLRASIATSAITVNQYNSLTSEAGFPASIGSSVKLGLFSSRNKDGTAPSGAEYVAFKTGDATPQATYAPRLTVVTDASFGQPPTRRRPSGLYVR